MHIKIGSNIWLMPQFNGTWNIWPSSAKDETAKVLNDFGVDFNLIGEASILFLTKENEHKVIMHYGKEI